jgi:hypothetical protein
MLPPLPKAETLRSVGQPAMNPLDDFDAFSVRFSHINLLLGLIR